MLDLIDTKGKKDIKSITKITSNTVFLDMEMPDYNVTTFSMDFKDAIYKGRSDSRDDSPGREIFQGKAAL